MNRKRTFILSFIYLILLVIVASSIPKELDWGPNFKSSAKIPYGSFVLFEELETLFPNARIEKSNRPIYNQLQDYNDSISHAYIIVTEEFSPDSLDWSYLKDFVSAGNIAFIAAEQIGTSIEEDLNIYMTSRIDYAYSPLKMDSTRQLNLRLLADDRSPQGNYKFNQMRKTSYIATDQDSVNDNKLFSLGEISDVGICYAKIPYGAGTIFMHSIPYVFTNYNMLKADNQEYISKSCSFFDVNNIIWDEYYKPDKNLYKASTLSVLLGYKSFKWAYWISIGTLVLFFIFRTKREQRMIPIISPFQNSSEEFSKTISGLFYEHASNKEIALKKIRLFKEYLHQQYYLGDFEFSEEEASVLSFKSGKSLKELEKLFFSISRIEKSAIVSNPELLDFSDQLNRFLDRK